MWINSLAAACDNRMNTENKVKMGEIEARLAEMTERGVSKAKNIGSKVGTNKASERLASQSRIATVKKSNR